MNRYRHTSYAPPYADIAPRKRTTQPATVPLGVALDAVVAALDVDPDAVTPALYVDERTGALIYLAGLDTYPVPVVTVTGQHPSPSVTLEGLRWLDDALVYSPHRDLIVGLMRDFGAFLTRDTEAFIGVFTRGKRLSPVAADTEPRRMMRGPGRSVSLFVEKHRITLALAWVADADEVPPKGPRVRWF